MHLVISKSINNNSTGPDDINIRHLKHLGLLSIRYLTIMYNALNNKIFKSGRSCKTTIRTDQAIKQICRGIPAITSTKSGISLAELFDVSTETIRRNLKMDYGLPARKLLKKPLLTKKMLNKNWHFVKNTIIEQLRTGVK